MTVKTVRVLHITAAAALSDDAGVVGTFYPDATASVETVVDIHPALGIMDIGPASVGAGCNFTAIGGAGGFGSSGRMPCRSTASLGSSGGCTTGVGGACGTGRVGCACGTGGVGGTRGAGGVGTGSGGSMCGWGCATRMASSR
jgi:hypothetical protein